MYLNGYKLVDIVEVTGLSINEPLRLLKKCCKLDNNNQPIGYSALIPYNRNKEYQRKIDMNQDNNNYAGMFIKLLNNYPELEEYIKDLYWGKDKTVKEKNISIKVIHNKFLKMCKKLGIKEYEYRFNTVYLGLRSLNSYVNMLNIKEFEKSSIRYSEDARQKLFSTGIKTVNNAPSLRPFSVVQLDGHKIDCILTTKIKTLEGDYISKPITRIWLLTVIDVATRAILGYHITIFK